MKTLEEIALKVFMDNRTEFEGTEPLPDTPILAIEREPFLGAVEHILAAAFQEVLPPEIGKPGDGINPTSVGVMARNGLRQQILNNLRLFSPEVAEKLERGE